jgi:hypothetical protein
MQFERVNGTRGGDRSEWDGRRLWLVDRNDAVPFEEKYDDWETDRGDLGRARNEADPGYSAPTTTVRSYVDVPRSVG